MFYERRSRVLVRPVPASYGECLRSSRAEIDVPLARAQHAAYVDAIRGAGLEVVLLPVLDDAPDSVFVEDAVVVFEHHAVLTRPGAPSRRNEGRSIVPHLTGRHVVEMLPPATLDGGDVLRVGNHVFVGLSARTNRAGFEMLAEVAKRDGLEPISIEVRDGLHLKSLCSRVDDAIIGLFDRVDPSAFRARGIALVEAPEERGTNVLDVGSCVIVSAAATRTAKLLGSRAVSVDLSELHKGDGALTCLSVVLG